jgi:multiple sugar transport system substrate-binding protein
MGVRRSLLVLVLFVSSAAACGGSSGLPTLNWYINPDNGGQADLAQKRTEAASGRYRIKTALLPNDATAQREQLVRRLAANDSSIDLMSLDPPFVAEFANAGFLQSFSDADVTAFTDGVLKGPVASATWKGRLVAAPFWANTQLLWFRKSVALKAGIDPSTSAVTWDQVIKGAEATGATVEVQADRYEGYMVWINALVSSAGGKILTNPEAGKDVQPGLDTDAGKQAAGVIRELATSSAADPALSTSKEEPGRAAFQGPRGGFMVNWAYIYGAAQEAVADGSLPQSVLDDISWGRYPQVTAGQASRPPLGGIDLAVGAFSKHADFAIEAVKCITTDASEKQYMLKSKNPAARTNVYDDAEVRKVFPMADLIRESIDAVAPRPQTPYYTDVSTATVRTFHPPASVDPQRTPADAAQLIVDVLHDRRLL